MKGMNERRYKHASVLHGDSIMGHRHGSVGVVHTPTSATIICVLCVCVFCHVCHVVQGGIAFPHTHVCVHCNRCMFV